MGKQHVKDSYELLFDSASGDMEAYQELFERYGEKLYNFVYYLTYSREESEDITSEAFIKVFEALQGRDVTSFNFQAYLYKTARNLSLKAIERRKREGLTLQEAEDFSDPSIFADPERAALLTDQRLKVKDASEKLTEDQQAALLLRELENLPYDTIAEVLDSNPNAVGALLSRARLKFREVYRMTHAQTEGVPDTCAQITPLLSSYIDGEATPEQKEMVEAHLASCPICNANLESMQDASVTYRGLVPILPLATLKVWGSAQSAMVGGKVAAWAGASAEAGASAAGTAAGTTASATASAGFLATLGSSLAYKVTAIVLAALLTAGIGVGGYFAVTKVVYAKKQVPSLIGLKESEATRKAEAAGLKCSCNYPNTSRTGNEVVTVQSLKPGTKVDGGTLVSLTMQDKEMEADKQACIEAAKKWFAQYQPGVKFSATIVDSPNISNWNGAHIDEPSGGWRFVDSEGMERAFVEIQAPANGGEYEMVKQNGFWGIVEPERGQTKSSQIGEIPPLPQVQSPTTIQGEPNVTDEQWTVTVEPSQVKPEGSCNLRAKFLHGAPYGNDELWFLVQSGNGTVYGKKVQQLSPDAMYTGMPRQVYTASFPDDFAGADSKVVGVYTVYFVEVTRDSSTGNYVYEHDVSLIPGRSTFQVGELTD